tara:strand:+ start:9694 stop:12192 length:2499 start_codon:yes stop_codon:yes gene_type:complete
MYRYFLLFFIFICSLSFSQNRYKKGPSAQDSDIYGKISGLLKDKETKLPLSYANITLLQIVDDNQKNINGTISNEKGYFVFDELEVGAYIVEFTYNGYLSKSIDVNITGKKLNKNLKNIFLELDTYILNDIQLSTEAPIYENKIEKIVYNVENDISQSANDGIDVLRNAPLVSVDIDDKISLRGSENVKFLLNGKTSSFLHKGNISDVLQTIPAEQIKSIEIITSPGAKYDADGDAGIINIITNQKSIEGFNASVNTNTGTRVNRSSFNLNAGKNRFGISASGGARYGWPRDGNLHNENTVFDSSGLVLNRQIKDGVFVGNWIGYRGSVDIYYDINKYNSITSNIHVGGHDKFNEAKETVSYIESIWMSPEPIEYLLSDTSSNKDTEYEYTFNYIKTFPDKEGQELMVSFQYGGHIHDDDLSIEQIGYDDIAIDNMMDGNGYELTGQVDYVHPLGDDDKIEIGIKRINRYTTNDYYTDIDNIVMLNWLPMDSLSNVFHYDQVVSAAYFSSNFSFLNDFGVLMGARLEHTNISGAYDNYYDPFDNSYTNIVPNLTVSKKINMFQTLKLSYTNRIERPDIHRINTNIEITDLNNISKGNPNLKPSQSHQIELGYTSFKPGLMTSFFLYYKEKYDVVEAFTYLIDDNIFETNYINTGDNHSYGFNFFGSSTIKKLLTLRGSLDIYTYDMSTSINNVELSRNSLNYKYSVSANLELGQGYKFETRTFFRSPRQTIQGERPSFSMMSFGLKKDFSNKRGSIGIGMIEPFYKYKSFATNISGERSDGTNFENIRDYEILFRSVNISFKYQFGKLDFDPIKKKASLENNDVMEEDGDGH